jgi:hypothetical protein
LSTAPIRRIPVEDGPTPDREAGSDREAPVAASGVEPSRESRFPRWAPRTPVVRTQLTAGALVTLAVSLQEPAPEFMYDAGHYWNGALAVLEGGGVFERGLLSLRGIATSFLYLPAAAAYELGGDSGASFAVLLQNALLIALIGTVLLPRLAAVWRPVTPLVVWVTAVGSALLLAGFAPFPLSDLWGVVLLLGAVAALRRTGWLPLLLAGMAAGLAFNVRPAAMFAVIGLVPVVLVARRLSGLWFLAGAALALIPQVVLNRSHGLTWWPWPEQTTALTQLQAGYAGYVIRYDTVMMGPDVYPRLFFCSPSMAGALDRKLPTSGGDLAGAFLSNFPQALVFSAQKIAAALHWTLSTPYYVTRPGVNGIFALLVTTATVVGAVALLHVLVRRGWRSLSLAQVAVVVVWIGSVMALVTSATESRFALPVVLIGIAGCGALVAGGAGLPRAKAGRLWLAGGVLAVVAVFGLGTWGLQHPLPGDGAVADCAGS